VLQFRAFITSDLQKITQEDELELDSRWLEPAKSGYARRLLYQDPDGRYEVRVMVWNRGQGTPLHDHAGLWCVECVYRGRIRVVSFSMEGEDAQSGLFQFQKEREILAGVGDAGALIPPFEYHTISNPTEEPAVTIHVYGGGMNWCHVFEPEKAGYRRIKKELQDIYS
jgi:predicted metal-dependent enzyme (double-stranded beta helix superfamily)